MSAASSAKGSADGAKNKPRKKKPPPAEPIIPRGEGISSLPPTAQKFLRAARRLLHQGGFDALRLEAIANEAGENRALIRYYFGGKDGLVAALVDTLTHDATIELVSRCEELPRGDERVHVYLEQVRHLVEDSESFLTFYDVLPHGIRDPELRSRIADLYTWYREINKRCLGLQGSSRDEKRLSALAMIVLATVDGLALQCLLDPGLDVKPAFQLLESIVDEEVSYTAEF